MDQATVRINRFDGGMANDPRTPESNKARVITNFDVTTNPYKMTPYRDTETGDSSASTSQKQNFCIGLWTIDSSWRLFALGVKSGAATAEILMKTFSDLADATWDTPANNQSSAGAANFGLFHFYKKTGKIYGARANQYVYEFTPDGATGWNDSKYDYGSTFTNISDAITHSKDDIMYFAIDNKIIKNDNGTFSVALTLPSHFYISRVAERGNDIAIAASPLSGVGSSRVFIWDRSATLATLQENVDWGEGDLKWVAELEGVLLGASIYGNNSTRLKDRVVFKAYDGFGGARIIDIFEGATSTSLKSGAQRIDGRIYFLMSITLNGSVREGLWSIGRRPDGTFSVVHELTPNNDTALVSSSNLYAFIKLGDYFFLSYLSSGAFGLAKINDQESYTATSIWESLINQAMPKEHRTTMKQLVAVAVSYEPLGASAQCVLKYRVDGGAWTTVFTETTDNQVTTEMPNANGTEFTSGREYEFKIESTGGAAITELKYSYNVLETLL